MGKNTEQRPHKGRNISGLRRGNPGNKGGGRTPEQFKRLMRRLANNPKVINALRTALRSPGGKNWATAVKTALGYGYGQPQASVEVSGKLSLEQLLARSWGKADKTSKRKKKG